MTKTPTDPLWHRLRSFQFDDPDARLGFSGRLARENAWSLEFAKRVMEEYKRFCYLALKAGHPVTPSDQVDRAWHLHLVYTESYWQRFCGDVPETPRHHGPTRGGALENAKYHGWYSATLASYQQHFGAPPPADIWPDPTARFRDAGAFRRVDSARCWMLPKPALGLGLKPALLPGLAASLTLAACAAQAVVGFEPVAETVLVILLVLFLLLICLVVVRNSSGGKVGARTMATATPGAPAAAAASAAAKAAPTTTGATAMAPTVASVTAAAPRSRRPGLMSDVAFGATYG